MNEKSNFELPLTKLNDQQLDEFLQEINQPFSNQDQQQIQASVQSKIQPKRGFKLKRWFILAATILLVITGATFVKNNYLVKKPVAQVVKKKPKTPLEKAKARAARNKIVYEQELKGLSHINSSTKRKERTSSNNDNSLTAVSMAVVSIRFDYFKGLITKTSFASENNQPMTIYQVFVEKVYDGDPSDEGKTVTIKTSGGKLNNSIVQINGYDPAVPGTEVVVKIPEYANSEKFTVEDRSIFYRTPNAKQFTLHRPADLGLSEKQIDQNEEKKINQMVKRGVTPARTKYLAVLTRARKSGLKQALEMDKTPQQTYNKASEIRISSFKNFAEMDQKSSATVAGVVTAWTKVPNAKNTAVTILSIYVYRGLTAKSKHLAGKTIYVYQQGGYITRRNLLNGMSSALSEQQLNQEIFSERLDFRVARIGTEVVLNLSKVSKHSMPKGEKVIDRAKSYSLREGEKSMWVKNEGGQYKLVNENYIEGQQAQELPVKTNSAGDQEITAEINRLIAKE
ncbi:hypothetical protein [Xylocopilactobacillus apis]|uniref:Uncharacterized protein n=1 Tax=Xylocopilactobacillus apis TaxID=2932183 RepID=A0AAU9DPX4_9LACO|nr:hypothetical protein [Xylocopilactobacillus apis]BDR57128.1 hypothetical protein KIMC2_16900 [Xylocopilactobacillus apis]